VLLFFFASRRRHTRFSRDWSSDVCSSDLLWRSPDEWGDLGSVLDEWIEEVSEALAEAVTAAISVIDVQTVVLDGAFPRDVRTRRSEERRVGKGSRAGWNLLWYRVWLRLVT